MRPVRAWVAATLVAGTLTAVATGASAATASTTRPAAPAIAMRCGAGQFDINTTDPNAVAAATGVTADVAKRWVVEGPWWQPSDLLTVQGIGPGWLNAEIHAGMLCATLPSTPPPAFAPCTGSKTDIDTASPATLRSTFGLNSTAAASLVAGRPYMRLNQISPERVPGLGSATQTAIVKNGCLTPPTVTTATATWTWAYADTTTTDTRGLYALSVPAGTISTAPGAWLSVTDARSPSYVTGPTADFHIWGTWTNPPASSVTTTLPLDAPPTGADTGQFVQGVIHWADSGPIFYSPAAEISTATTVTVPVDSLSRVTSASLPAQFFSFITKGYFTVLEWEEAAIRWYVGAQAEQPVCGPNTITGASTLVSTNGSALQPQLGNDPNTVPVKYCVANDAGPGEADWKVANNTGSVRRYFLTGNSSALITDRLDSGDKLTDLVFATGHDSMPNEITVPPGGGANIYLDPATDAQLEVDQPDRPSAIEAFITHTIWTVIGSTVYKTAQIASALYGIMNDCGLNNAATNWSDPSTWLHCATDLAQTLPGLIGGAAADVVGKVLAVVSVALSTIATLEDDLLAGNTTYLNMSTLAPPPSTQPGSGSYGPGDPGSVPSGTMLILKVNSGPQSWLWDSTSRIAYPIQDGGTYQCLAFYWPVVYGLDYQTGVVNGYATGGISSTNASCPPPIGSVRQLNSSDAHGMVLRQASGNAYYIDGNGLSTPLFSGDQQVACAAAQNHFTWDDVTDAELSRFTPSGLVATTFCP